jgi:hypothetical protein
MTDSLKQLIAAAEAKREAELAVQAILAGLREDLDRLCQFNSRLDGSLAALTDVCRRIQAQVGVLTEVMAAYVHADADALRDIRQRIEAAAFDRERPMVQIGDVHAGRDARLNVAGRDLLAGRAIVEEVPAGWRERVLGAAEDQGAEAEGLDEIRRRLHEVEHAIGDRKRPKRDVLEAALAAITAVSPAAAQVLVAMLTGGRVIG